VFGGFVLLLFLAMLSLPVWGCGFVFFDASFWCLFAVIGLF
jgi:hypothetical protein